MKTGFPFLLGQKLDNCAELRSSLNNRALGFPEGHKLAIKKPKLGFNSTHLAEIFARLRWILLSGFSILREGGGPVKEEK
jgi:hypothetical protein